MRAVFDFNYDDLVAFNNYKLNSSPVQKKNAARNLVFCLIGAVLVLGGEIVFGSGFKRPWPSVLCALGFLYLAFAYKQVNFITMKRLLKKLLEHKNSIDIFGENKLELFDDFMRSEVEGRIWEVSYAKINRIESNGRTLYLYYGSLSMIPLKLNAFAGPQEKMAFLDCLTVKLPGPMTEVKAHIDPA